ncbi:MAG: Xaa-Pro aminopeptidase [Bdellovibrionaceae bacterium]|nr:Xaa-Pro aminopeptidase [Pseudobdellovibrionaceae bacterium]|tara:strand:+ start:6490 stop:7818 length:1329 start_codon:yes stop_codon:yes gene_type:complete
MINKDIPNYYQKRREQLMKAHEGALFVLPSQKSRLRNPDVPFSFRQESNFYYLSGFEEVDSFLVLAPATSEGTNRSILFVHPKDPHQELWEGEMYGIEGAKKYFHVDEAYPVSEFQSRLTDYISRSQEVYVTLGQDFRFDQLMIESLEKVRQKTGRSGYGLKSMHDLREPLGEMRLIKSKEEIALMKKAAEINVKAHQMAMKKVRPGMMEYEVSALLNSVYESHGCPRIAYESIVGGGKNATCLHYKANNEVLNDGDLLLIDAGGEYGYYASDITRTFPVGTEFTQEQEKIYDIVLKAQKTTVDLVKPGVTFKELHQNSIEVITEGLMGLGFFKGPPREAIAREDYKNYYPHKIGHFLGIDVHDVGLYFDKDGEQRKLEPGMVLTVEPGIYCLPSDELCPEKYRGIGVRIEDDILVTDSGHENLTGALAKEKDDVLSLMNEE